MTIEEAQKAVEDAERRAHAAAQRLFGPGMTGPTSTIVNPARLRVLESLLVGLLSRESQYPGTQEEKALLELRDYWEAVTEEIRS